MPCPRCITRGKPSDFGSEPRCAFDNKGNFVSNNWNCATLNDLYDMIYEESNGWTRGYEMFNNDQHMITFPVPNTREFLVFCQYKSRGQVPVAVIMSDEHHDLTLAEAETILKEHKGTNND